MSQKMRKKKVRKKKKIQELNVVRREHNTIKKCRQFIHSLIHVIGQRKQVY